MQPRIHADIADLRGLDLALRAPHRLISLSTYPGATFEEIPIHVGVPYGITLIVSFPLLDGPSPSLQQKGWVRDRECRL